MKDKIKLLDTTFAHSILGYCSDYQTSELFSWNREIKPIVIGETLVLTDMVLSQPIPTLNNVAWLIEPIDIAPHNYTLIQQIANKFSRVFTYEKTLLELGSPYELLPFGCCWIRKEDHEIYTKTKNISIIASSKKQTGGHRLRHDAITSLRNQMDVFGRGYNPVEYKLTALKDYRFSIVIENCKRDYFFTEKLIDTLVTGTIPVYWGCPSIGDFFDTRGFIIFDSLEELKNKLPELTEEKYNEMLPFIKINFEKAKSFLLPDELIYKKLKNYE